MKLFFIVMIAKFFFLTSVFASAEESPTLKRAMELYKRKDYKEINKLSSDYIRTQNELNQDDKVIKLYFHTENDLQKLDAILDRLYKNTDDLSSKFHTLTYMLMEKSLLAEQYDIGVKWGDIYRKEAKSRKTKYIKGLYLYSCLLYKANKSSQSLSMIDNALKEKPNKKIVSKLKLLRIAQLKNDFQVIVESKNYLKNNYESTYADFIFAHMVQAYRNTGKKRRVEELKEDFKRDFGDSILVDTVVGI
jgi:predicted Zn-dependent protease